MIKFRMYSYIFPDRLELVDIVVPRVVGTIASAISGSKSFFKDFIINTSADIILSIYRKGFDNYKNNLLKDLSNKDLISILTKYRYKEGRDYTINENKKSDITINMNNGILLISMKSNLPYSNEVIKYFNKFNSQVTNMGKFTIISYHGLGRNELEKSIDMLMKLSKKVNIYDNN